MDTEVYSFALQSTLDEIHNICQDVKHAFVFKEGGEIIARDHDTAEEAVTIVVDSFNGILEKADAIGGIEAITLDGSKGQVDISCLKDLNLVTITSDKADIKYVNTITRVLVPTMLKLLEKINPAPLKSMTPPPKLRAEISEEEELEEELELESELEEEEESPKEKMRRRLEEALAQSSVAEPPASQLMIEDLGGLLVPSDTVRIDANTLSEWKGRHDGPEIEEVEVETFDGITTRCKVKPIKDSKYEGKGIIRMPRKIQEELDVKKGELVRVKPATG